MSRIFYTANGLKLNIDNIDNFENTTPKGAVKKTTPKGAVKKTTPKGAVKKTTPKGAVKKTTPKVTVKKTTPKVGIKKITPKLEVKKTTPKVANKNLLANILHIDNKLCIGDSCLDKLHFDELIFPKVIFYSSCDYKGTAVSVGEGSFDVNKIGLESNKINSMRVPQDVRVILHESIGLTGKKVTIDFDVPCFDSLNIEGFNWKNKVHSIQIDKHTAKESLHTMMGNNIKFSNTFSNFGKDSEYKAEISNDYEKYKQLLIVGNKSKGDGSRNVGILDNLNVGKKICINNNCINEHTINSNKLVDTRFERLTPNEYIKKGVGEYKELKLEYLKKDKTFQNVTTLVPIEGKVKQIIYSDDGMYYRTGINNDWDTFHKMA